MVKDIPKWLQPYLDGPGAAQIERAVQVAEAETSGEIVPMLVYRSTVASWPPLMGALCALLLMMISKLGLMYVWQAEFPDYVWAISYTLGIAAGFYLGHWDRLERWLIPSHDQKISVERRAMLAFYELGLSETKGRTGILLFVSFFERRAVVLADKGIAQHCQAEVFQGLVKKLVQAAQQHELANGFESAIAECKDLLKERFPAVGQNPNELKDYLRISW